MTSVHETILIRGAAVPTTLLASATARLVVRAWADGNKAWCCVQDAATSAAASHATRENTYELSVGETPLVLQVGTSMRLVVQAKVWDEPSATALWTSSLRTVVVSAVGAYAGGWLDGPLVHLQPGGRVLSYIPHGGEALLRLGALCAAADAGLTIDAAIAMEGTPLQQAERSVTAHLAAAIRLQTRAITVDAFSLAAVVALVLYRKTLGPRGVTLHLDGGKQALSPPWRRLVENLGLSVTGPAASAGTSLRALAQLIPSQWAQPLADALCATGPVIPAALRQ